MDGYVYMENVRDLRPILGPLSEASMLEIRIASKTHIGSK